MRTSTRAHPVEQLNGEDTMKRIIAITTAALALSAFSGAVRAQDADAPSVRVSYADLDLSQPAGRAVLNQRITHAVTLVCGERPMPAELDRQRAYDACRSTAQTNANRQVAAILGGSRYADASVLVKSGR
jgi:UrcA family protein